MAAPFPGRLTGAFVGADSSVKFPSVKGPFTFSMLGARLIPAPVRLSPLMALGRASFRSIAEAPSPLRSASYSSPTTFAAASEITLPGVAVARVQSA